MTSAVRTRRHRPAPPPPHTTHLLGTWGDLRWMAQRDELELVLGHLRDRIDARRLQLAAGTTRGIATRYLAGMAITNRHRPGVARLLLRVVRQAIRERRAAARAIRPAWHAYVRFDQRSSA